MFSLDLYKLPAEQHANNLTTAEKDQFTLLEDPIDSWTAILPKLRLVPENVKANNYSKTTTLGSGEGFMRTFEQSLFLYDVLYQRERSWGTKNSPSDKGLTLSSNPFKIFEGKDPSFAQRVTASDDSKFIFIGDIHSSFQSFVEVMNQLVERGILSDDLILDEKYFIFFLGDIFDRGPYALDILNIIFKIKNKNFKHVIVINGNHEDRGQYNDGGTGAEIDSQLLRSKDRNIVHTLMMRLPPVVFLQTSGKTIQLCHGGIHPGYDPLTFLESQYEFDFHGLDGQYDLVNSGLRWTDFNADIDGIGKSRRGGDLVTYGIKQTNEYLKNNKLEGIIRGHQDLISFSLLTRERDSPSLLDGSIDRNNESMFEPSRYMPYIVESEFGRTPFPKFFEEFSVATTSTATWSKDTGSYSYLELKSSTEKVKELQEKLGDSADRTLKDLGMDDELKFLKSFKYGETMKTKHADRILQSSKFMASKPSKFGNLFPLYELVLHGPFRKKKSIMSIFSKKK